MRTIDFRAELALSSDTEFEEEYGPFGRLVGAGSFLADAALDDVLMFTALELMKRAAAAGATPGAQGVLRHVLLVWMRCRRSGKYDPRTVQVFPVDLAHAGGQEIDDVQVALEGLAEHLPMARQDGWHGWVRFDLSPWLPLDDQELFQSMNRLWVVDHVEAVREHCAGARILIDSYLDDLNLAQARRPEAARRVADLRERRATWERRRRLTRPEFAEEALADLWTFHDEVAELEHLHDCVIGLLADPDGHADPFSRIWRSEGAAKLQALSLSPRSHAQPRVATAAPLRLVDSPSV